MMEMMGQTEAKGYKDSDLPHFEFLLIFKCT